MSQRTFGYLQDLRTPGGENYAYPTLQGANPTLKGYPVYVSSVIVNNEGGSTNASRISLVTMGNVLLGITKALEFAVSEEATVNGVSMFETDQTAIRATSEHDWEARYDETVAELTGVQWGA
jgi:HK97 family phage major capsid protein